MGQDFGTGSHLAPQELSHSDENAPEPLAQGEPRAAEGLPTKLHNDDLQHRREESHPEQLQGHGKDPLGHASPSFLGLQEEQGPQIKAGNFNEHLKGAGTPYPDWKIYGTPERSKDLPLRLGIFGARTSHPGWEFYGIPERCRDLPLRLGT